MFKMRPFLLRLLLLLSTIAASCSVPTHFAATTAPRTKTAGAITAPAPNPLSPKAALLRYWSRKIPNGQPMPEFLLSKASPLSAADSAVYERLTSQGQLLPARLRPFCAAANLLCFQELSPELDRQGKPPASFTTYQLSNFSNYGTGAQGGLASFKNYSDGMNVPVDSFRRYGRDSRGHDDRFSFYSPEGNVVTANFTSYASTAEGGHGDFTSYHRGSNVPDLKFTNYDAAAGGGRTQGFSSYSDDSNAGDQSFAGYGRGSDAVPLDFKSYAKDTNVMGSTFTGYSESASAANDSFTSYGFNGNVPENNFKSYAESAKGSATALVGFSSYRDQANVGDDSFQSYGKGAGTAAKVGFSNYGQSANIGQDTFKGYSQGASKPSSTSFKLYGVNTTFKDYSKSPGASSSFALYRNSTSALFQNMAAVSDGVRHGRLVNKWIEPGKFFRESALQTGNVMPMPDIHDKMPPRAFLPRGIADKMPFSSGRLDDIHAAFNATPDTSLTKSMADTVSECERAPSRGETKRCATSIEGMIDFATSVLGSDVVVRTTESTAGSGGDVEIGKVHGINGGRVTRSVSCHQSLYPYMVYYCHSVPKVRVYLAEILAVGSREVINHGVAICHLDTSDWSPGHGAFVALGPGPGKIEVCHWIFQGDMTWAVAD